MAKIRQTNSMRLLRTNIKIKYYDKSKLTNVIAINYIVTCYRAFDKYHSFPA